MSSDNHEQSELFEALQPAEIVSSKSPEGFQAPRNPYHRRWCTRVVLPWQHELPVDAKRTQRPTHPYRQQTQALLADVHQDPQFEAIEQLLVPGTDALEIILDPTPRNVETDIDPEQATFNTDEELTKQQVGKNLVRKAIRAFPDEIGIELVHVNIDGLGQTPVSTFRAVSRNEQGPSRSGKLTYNIPQQICAQLRDADRPFCLQAILDVESKTPKASFRLVVFDPTATTAAGRNGFAKHVLEEDPYDPHEFLQHINLTTNQQMPVDDYWHLTYTPDAPGLNAYTADYSKKVKEPDYRYRQTKAQADQIRKIHIGTAEFERFRRGDDNYNALYKKLGFYPRFNLTHSQLPYFFSVPPTYYDVSPWDLIAYRDGIEITTVNVEREAPGTIQSEGEGTDRVTDENDESIFKSRSPIQNDGSKAHITGGIHGVDWFEGHGIRAEELDQNSQSIPDFRLYPEDGTLPPIQRRIGAPPEADDAATDANDGESEYIALLPDDDDIETDVVEGEVEESAGSKAANMLDNAARAVMLDRVVLFIFPSKKEAVSALESLDTPYKRRTDGGIVVPYQSTRKVTLPDGGHPVHQQSETQWELVDGDTVRATNGADAIAEGPAADSVDSFDYDCPRYRKVDGKYVVETADGDVINEYHSKDRLTNDWTIIRKPHIPIGHTYLPRSILMYRDGDELRLVEPDPDWDGPTAMERHKGMIEATADELLVEEEGAEIEWETFREQLNRIYRRKTDWYPPPKSHVFGTALSNACPELETKRRNNPSRKFLKDHRWVYDPTIVSPDLPGYDEYEEPT